MSVIERIAYHQGRRDEVPNQELARELAEREDREGIEEIASHLHDRNQSVASDCLKVLYEVGYIDPRLIEGHVDDFLDLLGSRNNRMVWGGMIALSTVAERRAREINARLDEVLAAVETGTVITRVHGVRTLARVAAQGPEFKGRTATFLLGMLRDCPPKLLATHSEDMLPMLDEDLRQRFLEILGSRMDELSQSQATRVRRVMGRAGSG